MNKMNKVLLFDDDRYFAEDFVDLLSLQNIDCDVINNADDYMRRIELLEKYSVIFLDIMVRKGSLINNGNRETGELLFEKTRNIYKDKRIVIVSAKNKGDIKLNFEDPNVIFIKKPLSSNIKEVVDAILG